MARFNPWTAAPGFGVLLAGVFLATTLATVADPAPPAAVATLNLGDGRVLHNARVISDEGASVVIKADEGLVKVLKTDLPQALGAAYPAPTPVPVNSQLVMVPFNPSPADAAPEYEPGAKPKPAPAPANVPNPVQNSPLAFKGCTIVSFQKKAFQDVQGSAEVVIRNDTEVPVVIFPRSFVCITSTGMRMAGRNLVTDGFPPVIKRRDVVPAQGSIDDIVIFANDAVDISKVQWAR